MGQRWQHALAHQLSGSSGWEGGTMIYCPRKEIRLDERTAWRMGDVFRQWFERLMDWLEGRALGVR